MLAFPQLKYTFNIYYLLPPDCATENWKRYLKKSWADDFRTSTMTCHKKGIEIKKFCVPSFFLTCLNCTTEYFLTFFFFFFFFSSYISVFISKTQLTCILNNCDEKAQERVVLQIPKWKWATHNVLLGHQIFSFYSQNYRPNLLFSCVIFLNLPISSSKCANIWLIYTNSA